MESADTILVNYEIGRIISLEQLATGLIHQTWKVTTEEHAYILQRVSIIYSPAVMEDIDAATRHLDKNGCKTFKIVRTKSGERYVLNQHTFWRLITYIPGITYGLVDNTLIAYEAGHLLGRYHRVLSTLSHSFKHIRPIKNNIPALFAAYEKAVSHSNDPKITPFFTILEQMPTLDLPRELRKTVNHGDPKIENFIFSATTPSKALAIIDLDDCNRSYNVLYELSGALRSWCHRISDETNPFSIQQLEAALKGYVDGSEQFLLPQEWDHLDQALELNLLQLISRFVRDYFEDRYFAWIPEKYPSRKTQNLTMAQEHLVLYNDIIKKRTRIKEILDTFRS